jgi:hypothetical protein
VTSTEDERRGASPLGEVALVFIAITALTVALSRAPRLLPGLSSYVHVLVGGAFLLAAVELARREPDGMRRFGIDLAGMLDAPESEEKQPVRGPLGLWELARTLRRALPAAAREGAVTLAVIALVFPPFALGFYCYHEPTRAFAWRPPEDLASFALTQLLVVALPEEALFRGYVQTRLSDRWAPARRWLGVTVDPRALVLQAALFALLHFASIPEPSRLAVFFPALLFGLLRAWRGGIGAAMLLHAASNVLAEVLVRGWLA